MTQKKKKVIYIHGRLGAGKTSTADGVAKVLGYDRMSAGYFFRKEAEERNMSLVELNQYIQGDPSVDIEVDQRQKEYINSHEEVVLDGRLGFYLAPETIFNVFLELGVEIAALRILSDKMENPDRKSETANDISKMVEDLKKRTELERRKLKQLYGIEDCFDKSHFDLVVDTRKHNLDEVVDIVIGEYKRWLEE
ncbi:MAG: (d)CMP kinase [bacterium]|nr:(d)CMP kinase [bacterium]MDZ4231549.1 (d)CMP kinase [Patescibacteria group bacterium]